MLPQAPADWQERVSDNELLYLSELIIEMFEFFKSPENLTHGFDLNNCNANTRQNVNFGFAFEIALEINLVYFSNKQLRLTMLGYETAFVEKLSIIKDILKVYIGNSKLPYDDLTPY